MSVFETIAGHGLVPVVAIDDADRAAPLGEALLAGGLPCAEITFRTGAATSVIATLTSEYPGMLVGAGTVLTVDQARAAVEAGSRFIVSPGFDAAVVDWCLAHDVPVLPGVMTPTEIGAVLRAGLTTMKFFPAEAAGGLATLDALAGPFDGVRFMPTGGIGPHNLAGYLGRPAVLACGGSWMATRRLIADGDFAGIERLTAAAVDIVRTTREEG